MEKLYYYFKCFIIIIFITFPVYMCGTRVNDPLKEISKNGINSETAPTVYYIHPSDGSLSVPVNSIISVTFDKIMEPGAVKANTLDTACTGDIQVSSDNFSTCQRMSGSPYSENGNLTFTVIPAINLATGTTYKIRIKKGVKDKKGNAMTADYSSLNGFATNTMADTIFPQIFLTDPNDGSASINVNSVISVTFSEAMNPLTITANTADTVCTGSLQVSQDNFATCVKMSIQPFSGNGNFSFRVLPAANFTTFTNYKIRITSAAQDIAGNTIVTDYTTPSGFTTAISADMVPPDLLFTQPADGTIDVQLNSDISVTFTEAVDPATLTSNFIDTVCTGSFQISQDNFITCLRMTGDPYSVNGNITFMNNPLLNFLPASNYKIKLTTAIQDVAGNTLAADYIYSLGFTTLISPDATPPQIFSTTPADGATGVPLNSTISVRFNEAMNTVTITANTIDTACSGTFQVSSDGFSTCVQMSGPPVISQGNKKFVFTPSANLAVSNNYKIMVLGIVTDVAGNPLGAVYTTPTGFFTIP